MFPLIARLRILVSLLSLPLIGACALALLFMGLANEQPFARDALCSFNVCFYSGNADWWNKLIYDLSAGSLISIVFFWLFVRWPEHKKKMQIKRGFDVQYKMFKLACIENFLAVADGGFNSILPETLITLEAFRKYFKQEVADGETRWDNVANNMSDYYLEVTLLRMEAFRNEISFVLHNTNIDDEKVIAFLKALSDAMLLQRSASRDYDSINSFLSFFWQLFAGWNFVEGYRARDIVEEMVDSI